MNYTDKQGGIKSVQPPTKYLTFGPWIYMVPQYQPKDVLILGYGEGTVAGLIWLLYKWEIPITGVDILPSDHTVDMEFIQTDAKEYVKTCKKFDCVIVDLFDENGNVCDFVTTKEFVDDLSKIANYIIVNTFKSDMSAYNSLEYVGMNKPSGLENKIYYYQMVKIPDLRI